jgi:hypothetical protein
MSQSMNVAIVDTQHGARDQIIGDQMLDCAKVCHASLHSHPGIV